MHKNTKIKHVEADEVAIQPLPKEGFQNIKAVHSSLVVVPSPEDRKGVIIPDFILEELGYYYRKDTTNGS